VNCVLSDENRQWLEEKIRFERSQEARVLVEFEPEQWHPGIEALLTAHLEAVSEGAQEGGEESESLDALLALSPRQLAIYNALMRAADLRGCEAWIDLKLVELAISFGRGPVAIAIRKQQGRPAGTEQRLWMRVSSEFGHPSRFRDTDRSSIEDRLDEVLERVCVAEIEGRVLGRERISPAKQERMRVMIAGWERERAEAKLAGLAPTIPAASTDSSAPAIAEGPAPAAAPVPAVAPIPVPSPVPMAESAYPADEAARRQALMDEAARWHLSQQIRDYAAFISAATGSSGDWVRWASAEADAMSPAAARIAKIKGASDPNASA
jgi:hypothetical protein